MSERRSRIAPPEIRNGSTSGRVSSNSSARAMRMVDKIEEMQLPRAPLHHAGGRALEQRGDQAVLGVEDEGMQRPRGPRAVGGGILREGQLEEGMQLDRLAAAARVLQHHAARADVPGA